MLEKILVTGSTGLVGRALQTISNEYPEYEFVFWGSNECDLTDRSDTIERVETLCPDAIIHLAAIVLGIGVRQEYPATILRKSIGMNFNVLEAARFCNVKKVIMTLSSGMYSDKAAMPYVEEAIHCAPPDEHNYAYIHSKRMVEPMIKAYRKEYGLNVIGLVPNWLFGEYDTYDEGAGVLPSLIRRFCENVESEKEIEIWGDGRPRREYTHSEDIARAYLWCLGNYDGQGILNIGTTEENSIRDMAFMIADFLEIRRDRIVFDLSKPNGALRKSTDNSKFVCISNFQYQPFEVGLERTISWYLKTFQEKPYQT